MRELVACAFIGPGRENGMNGMVLLARPGEVPAELYWKSAIIRVWPDANNVDEDVN